MRKTKEGMTTAQPGKLADEQEPTEKGIPKPAGARGGGWHQPQGQAGCSKGLKTGVAGISAGGRKRREEGVTRGDWLEGVQGPVKDPSCCGGAEEKAGKLGDLTPSTPSAPRTQSAG